MATGIIKGIYFIYVYRFENLFMYLIWIPLRYIFKNKHISCQIGLCLHPLSQ